MNYYPHFQKLVARARNAPPMAAAVVYPLDRDALQLALSGAFGRYLAPSLVGPELRIREVAARNGLSIDHLAVVDTPDDPRAASVCAAQMARDGQVAALVKGSLLIEDLLTPVAAPDSGLRTETRLTHAYFLDLPGQDRGLLLTDAQLNVNPNLAAKRDIVQNAINLAHALGIATPRVGVLAAIDGPSAAFPSTAEAVALREMAAQGLILGGRIDGPFTPETALSADAAEANGVTSDIAGHLDVLVAPGMEAAQMVLRTLTVITRGLAAGLVLGARIPIVVTARGDSMESRMASCVLASLVAVHARDAARKPAATAEASARALA